MRHGLYIGWLGQRNLGDEVMYEACLRLLPEVNWSPVQEIVGKEGARSGRFRRWGHGLDRLLGREVGMMGGGTVINRNPGWLRAYESVRRRTGRPVPVFAPGVANPEFWSRDPGWADTRKQWADALKELPVVGVRGPISERLLREAGLTNHRVVGDPALILEEPPGGEPGTVVINAGRSGGQFWGDEDRVVAALGDLAARLRSRGMRVLILPVWDQDVPVCIEVSRAGGLPAEAVLGVPGDSGAFFRSVAPASLVVSTKLHAAVLAACACRPFIALEYRPKVRDFAASLGWEEHVVRTDEIDAEVLEKMVLALGRDPGEARGALGAAVSRLRTELRTYSSEVREILLA